MVGAEGVCSCLRAVGAGVRACPLAMSRRPATDGTGSGLVRASIRKSADAFATEGWRVTQNGLVYHADDGHWGRINFDVGPANGEDDKTQTPIELTAGAASPYLLRVVNRLDPARQPSVHYLHASLLWQVEIEYQSQATVEAPPMTLPQPLWARTGIVLGPDTATTWFSNMLRLVVPAVVRLCTDHAIRDHLLANASETDFLSLRYSALLTRHMRYDVELPAIVQRAAIACQAFDAVQAPPGGEVERSDSDPNMLMWTHEKFVRFLAAAPR